MAANKPATIGDLTDELLACVFAPLSDESIKDRCALLRVCRRWRAFAAAPAGAPLWARAAIRVPADPEAQVRILRWLDTHGPHVRKLHLAPQLHGSARAWDALTTAMARAPGMLELGLDCSLGDAPPGGAEWWRHLGRGLTRLTMLGDCCAPLARAPARDGLPASLLELELCDMLGDTPHAGLPCALGALSRLTRLALRVNGTTAPNGDAHWRPLRGLTALRSFEVSMFALEDVLDAVGALIALTCAEFDCCQMNGTLAALAPLASSLRQLSICPFRIPAPSALTALTALEELTLAFDGEDLRAAAAAPEASLLAEPGPHLHRLRALTVQTHTDHGDHRDRLFVGAWRQLVEPPLRAATALTSLEFEEEEGQSALLLLTDDIGCLLAGKPALRRFALQKEHAWERDLDLAALREDHPALLGAEAGPAALACWWM